ncbi:acyltransferase family protein [Flavobacterium sedimenticola]|uniref:Acyltransferase n=1 Tax=Flavobacterium sedimenticola TaxID=3043286 RepID=A0ABT6XQ47_9FLAO|nr:acyltransferase [Flavobacterium sedimenticola]MDI9256789.1 acyltransferase [Flavobacterium sedimenticola]
MIPERRYDLDWLRVIAILLLHLFHCAMPFMAEWDWHLKNKETSNLILECNYFVSRWRMPVLFFISGIGTIFVLNQKSIWQFIAQRTKRLFVPLLFGMLIIIPPQVYFERIYKGTDYHSYLDFYPSIFTTTVYPEGNLSWHHLWFIAYLFVYSLLAIPLILIFKSEKGKAFTNRVAGFCEKYSMVSFGIILSVASFLYFWYPNETHAFVGDGAGFTKYFLYFLFGAFIGINPIFWRNLENNRRFNLKIAFFSAIVINFLRWNDLEPNWETYSSNLLFLCLVTLSAWFWVISFLGYAKKYLNFTNTFLQFANEAIYPFYILHQTFIVIIAYYVIQTPDDILSKYLFLTLVSFVLSFGFYVFLIKPYKITRFLFGMKIK